MILIGNNIVNISATVFIVHVASTAFNLKEPEILIVPLIQSIFFLLFCEILPKIVARAEAEKLLRYLALPILFLMFMLKPFVKITLYISHKIKDIFHLKSSGYSVQKAREEINVLFKIGEQAGIIDESHQVLIDEILSLHDITVSEVMTPTIEITCVEKKQSIREVVKCIEQTRFSRIPVYEDRVDNIIGYIYYKDLFKYKKTKTVEELMRKTAFVPVTKKIYQLYKEMKTNNKYIVFGVNEFGAVEGIVTREDIAEEVVGEIQTKDHFEEDIITKISVNKYSFNGSLDIEYFSRYFNVNIKKEGFETVAGFLTFLLGYFPVKGEKITYKNFVFIIDSSTEKSISRVSLIINKKSNSGKR
jgi:putative hemolysin